jgi:hypothetical protein
MVSSVKTQLALSQPESEMSILWKPIGHIKMKYQSPVQTMNRNDYTLIREAQAYTITHAQRLCINA